MEARQWPALSSTAVFRSGSKKKKKSERKSGSKYNLYLMTTHANEFHSVPLHVELSLLGLMKAHFSTVSAASFQYWG